MSTISSGTTLTTALVQTGDTTGNLVIKTGASNTTAMTISGTDQSITFSGGISLGALTTSGNLTFTGTGNRIIGDMSNATLANRVSFQTSTTNGNTSLQAIPNGTGNTANFRAFNSSDPNNSSYLSLQAGSAEAIINSTALGTGTLLPLTMFTGGSERLRIDTSGNVGIGTSSPSSILHLSSTLPILTFTDTNDSSASRIYQDNTDFVIDCDNANAKASSALAFRVDNSERMRIDSSGNVGIKNTAPQGTLDVGGVGGSQPGDLLVTTGSTTAEVIVGRLSGTSSDNTNFKVRNRVNEVSLLVNAGNKTLQVGKSISVGGATPTASGSGITFPATQDSSSDANTLDDYEEGTWTPVMTSEGGSITSYTSEGTYTKIGNTVRVTGYTVLTTVGTASGRAFIAGFPFAGTSSTDFIQPGSISREAQATGYIYFAYINGGNTNGVIQNSTAGAIAWSNGYRYSWTITYKC
jgi:hypothetical protein